MVKLKLKNLFKRRSRHSGTATSPVSSPSASAQPQPQPGKDQSTLLIETAPLTSNSKPTSCINIRERIWKQAYDESREEEPDLVNAFENIVAAKLHHQESAESTTLTEDQLKAPPKVTPREILQFVQDGIKKTAKEAAVKQRANDGLQAVQVIRGLMEGAVRAAPEAAVVWAAVSLGIEILSNPITEALENRNGIQYVLCGMGWYWNLADLLLDKNKCETATAAMQEELEKDIVQLFQKLLLYQMRSVRLYHRSRAAVITRDMFRIDDWTSQLNSIKEVEETVQRHIDQYNTQENRIRLQNLKDTAISLQQSLQSIDQTMQNQLEQQAQRHEDDHDKQCLSDFYLTDPRIDKKEIEDKKGGLLKDSYKWILGHPNFQQFLGQEESRILWIRGDPGKGKTMLLCGLIDELESCSSAPLSYFFCQATGGSRFNKATSVLRGLIYHLACSKPQLTKYLRMKYDYKKDFLNSVGAWHDLCEIATSMLDDPCLKNAIFVVDALDECTEDLQRLLDFITKPSSAKWIVSSRNWPEIGSMLDQEKQKVKIHLELNQESVSTAVQCYIIFKVEQLAHKKGYDEAMKKTVAEYLTANAQGTFLWVALVCQELSDVKTKTWHTMETLKALPPGLGPLYERMLEHISQSKDGDVCKEVLATVLTVYRPITVKQLHALVEQLGDFDEKNMEELIALCGSFLTLHDNFVYFVHQSAKDYLLKEASAKILPSGIAHQHNAIFEQSLDLLFKTLKRDIYYLQAPGCLIDEFSTPNPDPLATLEYSCIFWIDHFHDAGEYGLITGEKAISAFFKQKYLQWLEALSLLRSFSAGGRAMERLESCLQGKVSQDLQDIVKDARRFLLSHGGIIEVAPLQVYVSALIFSPTNSLTRQHLGHEQPDWIELKPRLEANWSSCLRTLEGHDDPVESVVFSNDGQRLASGSHDKTVKIWDATSGACLQTLEGHEDAVTSAVFSNDGQRLASGSHDKTVKIWDATSGACLQTLEGHGSVVASTVFSNDGQRLASGSYDHTVKIWDATSGACLQTLEGHGSVVASTVFSNDGQRLASGSWDKTVKIWDATSGACLQTLEGHEDAVESVVFSNDGQRLASGSYDHTVKIWDATSGACLQTLEGHEGAVTSAVFSNDGKRLASGSYDKTVKIWDATSGACLQTLEGHEDRVTSAVFSNNRQRLASGSYDHTVKIWDATSGACLQTLEGHEDAVTSAVFSNDGKRLASGSWDKTVKIWDATSGACLQTLEGHESAVTSAVFSNDGRRLASGSGDKTVKIWDATFGACLQTLEGHEGPVTSAVFSNDGKRLASGSWDKTVKIWDATSGACLQTLEGHGSVVVSTVFSNDGRRLASGSGDKTVKIWDATFGACLQTLEGHEDEVTSAVFSNNKQRLASWSRNGTVNIWDATSGACLQTLDRYFVTYCHPADFGFLNADLPVPATMPSIHQPSLTHFNFCSYSISDDLTWIMKDDKRVLWLPPDYRPERPLVVAGANIALACRPFRIVAVGFKSTVWHENSGV